MNHIDDNSHMVPTGLVDYPIVPLHVRDVETLYNTLEWQRIGARAIVRHYLNLESVLALTIEQCRWVRNANSCRQTTLSLCKLNGNLVPEELKSSKSMNNFVTL